MVSLYFHIPFCTKKCPYCHFYVIPNNEAQKELLLQALLLEWELILPQVLPFEIVSIYFGGGTPTLFGAEPIAKLLKKVRSDAKVAADCEITLEANPEDVTATLMQGYKAAGINRVSLGVQSLDDSSLSLLQRTHDARRAIDAITLTYEAGLTNISIDLMYELPDQTTASFQRTLLQLERLPITHLSLYNLTIEPGTAFFKRTLNLPSPEDNLTMLEMATSHLDKIGLSRYEISAFSKPNCQSRHNTGYWTGRPFFGLGPSAFSYFEGRRFRNVAHIHRYVEALKTGKLPIDFEEKLPYPHNVQERLAVQLRLLQGVNTDEFDLPEKTNQTLNRLVDEGFLIRSGTNVKLTEKGLLFYDTVATEII